MHIYERKKNCESMLCENNAGEIVIVYLVSFTDK